MSEEEPGMQLGQLIDALGVEIAHREGDLISDALVICKIVDRDGDVRLSISWSDGMSWIERIGMISMSLHTEQRNLDQRDEDE